MGGGDPQDVGVTLWLEPPPRNGGVVGVTLCPPSLVSVVFGGGTGGGQFWGVPPHPNSIKKQNPQAAPPK